MSAAPQLLGIWAAASALQLVRKEQAGVEEPGRGLGFRQEAADEKQPLRSLAFYRKHTESLLRRYLYASMAVGRSPSLLDHPVARGWATSRPVRTFEEAVNFVLDIERCLARLTALDRFLLSRIVLQEYTVNEVSIMLRISFNTVTLRLSLAVDRLTELLLKEGLLVLPR